MKQKASRELHGQLNARGFEQLEGQHYFVDTFAASVTNLNSIRILLMLMCVHPNWIADIVDVEGTLLQGKFKNSEVMYNDILNGMEQYSGSRKDVVLLLNVPIYGTQRAASCFYKTMAKRANDRGYE